MWRLFFLFLFPVTATAQLKRFTFSEHKMGSSFTIIFYHTDSTEANTIAGQCFTYVDSLNNIFSDYSSASEVGKLASLSVLRNQEVSPELFELIQISKHAWRRSNKSFDITIGALTQLWRKVKAEKRFPSREEINSAKAQTGFQFVRYDIFTKEISTSKEGIRFDFGGIIPGYIAQKLIEFLKTKNINSALIDASGDIVVGDPPPGKVGWSIAINLPGSDGDFWNRQLVLKNLAVSTSGDLYRYILHDGKKYSHIIDPQTGYGVTSQRNVTVISKKGDHADWLATACSILPIKKALRLVRKENASAFIATLENEKIIVYKSKNFDRYFEKKQD